MLETVRLKIVGGVMCVRCCTVHTRSVCFRGQFSLLVKAYLMSNGKKCLSLRPIPASIQRVAVYETRTVSQEKVPRPVPRASSHRVFGSSLRIFTTFMSWLRASCQPNELAAPAVLVMAVPLQISICPALSPNVHILSCSIYLY